MKKDIEIIENNKDYWNKNADLWFGTTALPEYGVKCVTEDELMLFGDVNGKKMLEICCGSGHSLKYHGERGAGELWGTDLSEKQLMNAERLLNGCGIQAKLIASPMEIDPGLPKNYFDFVYSIYGIGWTTDLDGTFGKIASYLKTGGVFIFSWHHPLNYCVAWSTEKRTDVMEDGKLLFGRSYFDESYFKMPVHNSEIILSNRKISTYVNALARAGFCIEKMVEETDNETMTATDDLTDKMKKAKMLPISVIFKARKL